MNVHCIRYLLLSLLTLLLLGCAPATTSPTPQSTNSPAVTPLSDVGELGALLEQQEGGTFAGLWIEREPRYQVVVAFTRNGEETIRPYIEGGPLAGEIEVRSADVTYIELQNTQKLAHHLVDPLGLSTSSSIDIQVSHVELYVTDEPRLEAALEEANVTLPERVMVIALYEPVGDNPPFPVMPEASVFMPQLQARSTDVMQALLIGELVVQNGCLRVQSGEESQLVIWQADYFLNNRDGTLEILDETGKMVAYVGETVYMGGGEVSLTAQLEATLREPIPEACAKPQKVWLMGEFVPDEYKNNLQE